MEGPRRRAQSRKKQPCVRDSVRADRSRLRVRFHRHAGVPALLGRPLCSLLQLPRLDSELGMDVRLECLGSQPNHGVRVQHRSLEEALSAPDNSDSTFTSWLTFSMRQAPSRNIFMGNSRRAGQQQTADSNGSGGIGSPFIVRRDRSLRELREVSISSMTGMVERSRSILPMLLHQQPFQSCGTTRQMAPSRVEAQ